MSALESAADDFAVLSPNGRKARYGPAYVRAVCAQAGVKVTEASPDEDVLAVDLEVGFHEANVGVQVKCTGAPATTSSGISVPLDESWTRKWSRRKLPTYLVVVVVPGRHDDWMRHDADGTFHAAVAYWARIKIGHSSRSMVVPLRQRLTRETVEEWHQDLLDAFAPRDRQ